MQSTFGIVKNLHTYVPSENLKVNDCPSEDKEDGIRGNVRMVGCSAGLARECRETRGVSLLVGLIQVWWKTQLLKIPGIRQWVFTFSWHWINLAGF